MLITLGIDSLFSMTEAIATFFYDTFPSLSKKKVVFFVCLACFIFGLVFTTSAGIYFLDITDHFITNYALAMMGLLQSLAFGWIYGPETMRKQITQVSKLPFGRLFDITMKYIIPLSLAGILIQAFSNDISRSYEEYPQWAIAAFGWGWVAFIYFTSLAYSLFEEKRS
jgi:NSS family neurotransmitter:Na+ symporter